MIFRLIFRLKFIAFLLFSTTLLCQEVDQEIPQLEITPHISSQRYFTGKDGIVRMYVNVWGAVKKPGIHLVYDGIDITTLMSITGGPADNARLSKIKLIREVPDDNGEIIYSIDFKKFIREGDRSDFLKVLPNDTYIVPIKTSRFILSQVNWVNTFLHILNLYLQIEYRYSR